MYASLKRKELPRFIYLDKMRDESQNNEMMDGNHT